MDGKFSQSVKAPMPIAVTLFPTVTEENAFWLNHTQTKYDKMNIKLKKTRYK